jgi:hypothetical protein
MTTVSFPAPDPGDIVWCRFPEMESIRPGPKPRPGLVVSVDDSMSPVRVRVAYGTTQHLDRLGKGDFVITEQDGAAYRATGLAHPTKFQFRKLVVLDYTDLWFAPAPGRPSKPTPKLGFLAAALMKRAAAAFHEATITDRGK